MRFLQIVIFFAMIIPFSGCAQKQEKVIIETSYGNIKIRLYDDTPLHRDNFLKLARSGFYDGLLFHRVIKEFMIQGGNPASRNAKANTPISSGDNDYKIDAEIIYPKYFHKKGVLAAARQADQVNPKKQSSASQFFIVQGKIFSDEELNQFERITTDRLRQSIMMKYMNQHRDSFIHLQQAGDNLKLQQLMEKVSKQAEPEIDSLKPYKIPAEHRATYTTIGGVPPLDNEYTIFGEVEEGMDVIDKIAQVETDNTDRPVQNIIMNIKVIKE